MTTTRGNTSTLERAGNRVHIPKSDADETELTREEAQELVARFEAGRLHDAERPRLWRARTVLSMDFESGLRSDTDPG